MKDPHRGNQSVVTRRRTRREAQDKVVALLAQGMTVTKALEVAGRSYNTYEIWRRDSPGFKDRADRAKGVAKGQREAVDFAEFRQIFFDRSTPEHHRLIAEAIESAPVDSISLVLAPPEAAKTSLLVDYACWKLALEPNFRIAIVCESHDLAKKILGQIARRMTDDVVFGAYIDRYGPFKSPERTDGKAWNANAITVLRADHDEKEPSVEARGATGQIYGARYDLLLVDDIQSTSNLGETEKLVQHFRQTMLSRVTKDRGKTVIVGSRVAEKDFYRAVLDAEDGDFLDRYISIPAVNAEGESYWPDYWPIKALERKRKNVGEEAWLRAYMQRPAAAEAQTFTVEMIDECLDRNLVMGTAQGTEVICSVDPALNGYTALCALACSPSQAWLVDVDSFRGLARTEEILNRMEAMTNRVRPSTWVVEIGAFQGALANDERLYQMGKRYGFSVVQHTTNRTKAEPVLGVGSMASMFTLKELVIPYGNPESVRKADELKAELLDWRPRIRGKDLKQDRVMALWFAWRQWTQRRRSYGAPVRREWRPSWLARSA